MKELLSGLLGLALLLGAFLGSAEAQDWPDRSQLPQPLSPFEGQIGKTYKTSTGDWQEPVSAPENAPNIIVILLDDVGFGQTGTFGGMIPTPELDELAAEGLKYTRFHTTAICGPTRAALLTGRNHHTAGNGFLMEWATGYPSYTTMIPKQTATISEVLKDNGYATWWFGKNHNTPSWESTMTGPFDRWPTGMGFDYFYGFNGGETDQYYPVLIENTVAIEPPASPDEGYHLLTDMTDRAIERMKVAKAVAPEKPFFMYFAPGAMHAPHQAAPKWREPFKGAFDDGWEAYREKVFKKQLEMGIIPEGTKLTPRPEWVPEWSSLNETQIRVYTTLMENYAGYMAFTDHEIGRLLDGVKQLPDAENTMVIYIVGDNGASAEGGPDGTFNEIASLNGVLKPLEDLIPRLDDVGQPGTQPHYPLGWAWAGDAPFQWVKQVASHLGGTRNPMVVSWPARIQHDDKPREAFLHVIDVVPTILEAVGVPMPKTVNGIEQVPLAGASFLNSFSDPDFKGRNSQYFEIISNRSYYEDGWKANAQHSFPWRQGYAPGNWEQDQWELYYLPDDFSEAVDLADKNPEKLAEMKAKFDQAAQEFGVYPLDDRGAARIAVPKPGVPGAIDGATVFTYPAGATRIGETAAPQMKNRSWTMTAYATGKGAETEGVLMAWGGLGAGMTFYIDKGIPVFTYNYFNDYTTLKGNKVVDGDAILVVDFAYDGGGKLGAGATLSLLVDGEQVAQKKMAGSVGGGFGIDTFGIGADTGQPVINDYKPPFPFTGEIEKVVIELK
ncbi:arylsulfatase [Nitrosococcus watsonii]|uniref:Sulfatase n=1 Tax=Nitrosococcus watsoni (strain C-113) TaxID=105559 RepID=D8K9Z5_NITWC|nr:arylsulfatase [Nitrosococcus watsonii]ADJ29353.1 sulfatase [Nitrosococcus watsonii C-113]